MISETALINSISKLSERLIEQGLVMATAESCTGGWIAKAATDLAGSSEWFDRGLVTYSNQAKQDMLMVPAETLAEYGAVSEQTVEAMLQGLLQFAPVDIGVAVSGIAGPGGGSEQKPVGTVWIGWQKKHTAPVLRCYHFEGDRMQVRLQAAISAVEGLNSLLSADI